MTTAVKTNRRSTATITAYIAAVDAMRRLAEDLKTAKNAEKKLRAEVLEQIGERREVLIGGIVRILEPGTAETIGQADTEATVAIFKTLGLPVSTRSSEYVPPATFSKYVKEGRVPEDLIERETETIVIVH